MIPSNSVVLPDLSKEHKAFYREDQNTVKLDQLIEARKENRIDRFIDNAIKAAHVMSWEEQAKIVGSEEYKKNVELHKAKEILLNV